MVRDQIPLIQPLGFQSFFIQIMHGKSQDNQISIDSLFIRLRKQLPNWYKMVCILIVWMNTFPNSLRTWSIRGTDEINDWVMKFDLELCRLQLWFRNMHLHCWWELQVISSFYDLCFTLSFDLCFAYIFLSWIVLYLNLFNVLECYFVDQKAFELIIQLILWFIHPAKYKDKDYGDHRLRRLAVCHSWFIVLGRVCFVVIFFFFVCLFRGSNVVLRETWNFKAWYLFSGPPKLHD